MKPTEPRDAAAIIHLAGGLLALLLVSHGQRLPGALVELLRSPPVPMLLVAAVLALLGPRMLRQVLSGRALGRRVRVQMIPTDGFDPQPEAVLHLHLYPEEEDGTSPGEYAHVTSSDTAFLRRLPGELSQE